MLERLPVARQLLSSATHYNSGSPTLLPMLLSALFRSSVLAFIFSANLIFAVVTMAIRSTEPAPSSIVAEPDTIVQPAAGSEQTFLSHESSGSADNRYGLSEDYWSYVVDGSSSSVSAHSPGECVDAVGETSSTSGAPTLHSPSPPLDVSGQDPRTCTCLSCAICQAEVLDASMQLQRRNVSDSPGLLELQVDSSNHASNYTPNHTPNHTDHNEQAVKVKIQKIGEDSWTQLHGTGAEYCYEQSHGCELFLHEAVYQTLHGIDIEIHGSDRAAGDLCIDEASMAHSAIGEASMAHLGTESSAEHASIVGDECGRFLLHESVLEPLKRQSSEPHFEKLKPHVEGSVPCVEYVGTQEQSISSILETELERLEREDQEQPHEQAAPISSSSSSASRYACICERCVLSVGCMHVVQLRQTAQTQVSQGLRVKDFAAVVACTSTPPLPQPECEE